ncbi:MAG: L-histidine N(alpha)-methyltransferase [Phycisphaerae bacterium]
MSVHPHPQAEIRIDNVLADQPRDQRVADIVAGLQDTPRRISSMYFYDDRGSQLFEQITRLPEYYPTRTEKALLRAFSNTDAQRLGDVDIVELGSGDCSKISLILAGLDTDALSRLRYVPVDVSEFAIRKSAGNLARKHPSLEIHGLVADFLTQLACVPDGRRRLFCLLGSTIGNFGDQQRHNLLCSLAGAMQPQDELLLGVDLAKSVSVLERAYNDAKGVTAAFNRNILRAVNNLAGTDFHPDWFEHAAFYNPQHGRIEMHLRANRDMQVDLSAAGEQPLGIACGETIHTENSYKFQLDQMQQILRQAGLELTACLQDNKAWFALLRVRPAGRGDYVGR